MLVLQALSLSARAALLEYLIPLDNGRHFGEIVLMLSRRYRAHTVLRKEYKAIPLALHAVTPHRGRSIMDNHP